MEVAVTSDVGAAQRFNDDAWCQEQLHRNVTLLAVADGFGRPQGTPSASIVLDAVREAIRRDLRRATFPPRSLTANDIREMLAGAFAAGNERLLRVGGGSDDHVAAGSTCTLVLIVSNQAFVAHVGDTRAYLVRRGELVQLTTDDALPPELVRSPAAQPGGMRLRQMPALLTRALGIEASPSVTPKIAHYTLHPHDAVLLCTDGVSRGISAGDLAAAVTRDTVRASAERIVALARGAGSTDNATVLLARNAPVHGPTAEGAVSPLGGAARIFLGLLAAIALFVASGTLVRSYWYGNGHLYLAEDSAGDVGLFAGVQGTLMGLPLHIERADLHVPVAGLALGYQRLVQAGFPVANERAAQGVLAKWQARSHR